MTRPRPALSRLASALRGFLLAGFSGSSPETRLQLLHRIQLSMRAVPPGRVTAVIWPHDAASIPAAPSDAKVQADKGS